MDELTMLRAILDSYSTPIVFVDDQYIIRYMNRYAKYHYHVERGYGELIGHSLFDCHNEDTSRQRIEAAFEGMKGALRGRGPAQPAHLHAARARRRRQTDRLFRAL